MCFPKKGVMFRTFPFPKLVMVLECQNKTYGCVCQDLSLNSIPSKIKNMVAIFHDSLHFLKIIRKSFSNMHPTFRPFIFSKLSMSEKDLWQTLETNSMYNLTFGNWFFPNYIFYCSTICIRCCSP